jgi:hypothetical protein
MKISEMKIKIVLLVFAAVTLGALASFHGAHAIDCSSAGGSQGYGSVCLPTDPTGVSSHFGTNGVESLIIFIIDILLAFAAILAVLFIIIGGYKYIFSGVSEKSAESGKKTLINAIIGLVIIILSYAIVTVLANTISNSSVSNNPIASGITALV